MHAHEASELRPSKNKQMPEEPSKTLASAVDPSARQVTCVKSTIDMHMPTVTVSVAGTDTLSRSEEFAAPTCVHLPRQQCRKCTRDTQDTCTGYTLCDRNIFMSLQGLPV